MSWSAFCNSKTICPSLVQAIENQVLNAAKAVEDHLDAQLDRLDKLDEDDIEAIRERRLAEMKRLAAKKQEWAAKGHGDYREIPTEKDFFSESKSSERVVCHFYRENWPCKVGASSIVQRLILFEAGLSNLGTRNSFSRPKGLKDDLLSRAERTIADARNIVETGTLVISWDR